MKIVFLSNFFNHHQRPLSDELYALLKGEFYFVETEKMPEERKKLGYKEEVMCPYLISVNGEETVENKVRKLVDEADIVIAGSVNEKWIRNRIKSDKIVFRYSERPLKNGNEWKKYLVRYFRWNKKNPKNKKVYLLAASAYASGDYLKFGLFREKAFKWGYFPETFEYEDIESLLDNKNRKEILWCGRMIDWKHPEDVLKALNILKNDGYDFHLNYVGYGELEKNLKELVISEGLEDYVTFLGAVSPENVRRIMEKAGIYVFSSDRREGWGAVLNEAMNSGCAVLASHEIGAVPYLLNKDVNGIVYESGNIKMLADQLKYLLEYPEIQKNLGREAYYTIVKEWNSQNAARRLIQLCDMIRNRKYTDRLFEQGVCSKAISVSDKWKG